MRGKIELVCLSCGSTDWEIKNTEGSILVHCAKCGTSAVVRNAAVKIPRISLSESTQDVQELSEGDDTMIVPEARQKQNKAVLEGDSDLNSFTTWSVRLKRWQVAVIKAAIHLARAYYRGLRPSQRGYVGTTLTDIALDFLHSVDFSRASTEVPEESREAINEALQEAQKALELEARIKTVEDDNAKSRTD